MGLESLALDPEFSFYGQIARSLPTARAVIVCCAIPAAFAEDLWKERVEKLQWQRQAKGFILCLHFFPQPFRAQLSARGSSALASDPEGVSSATLNKLTV